MAIPDFQTCMLPLLRTIQDGKEWSMKDITNELSDEFDLTPEEREGLIPSGNARVVVNRVGWAKMYLKEAGLLESVRRWPDENGVDGAMWGRFVLKNCYAPAY
jgi:restriction system protein